MTVDVRPRHAPPATYATRPTPGASHDADQVAMVAKLLGTPLMPWQYQVARIATERTATGWRWPTVVITVPRQSGKTTLMRAVLVQRAIVRPKLLAYYTAQTGKDAAARWADLVEAVQNGPLGGYVDLRKAAGSQALTFTRTGSRISPFAPTPKSLHGYTPPLVMVDECFAFDQAQGTALMGAISPAQVTIPDRQLWIVSTAGSAESTWLREWVETGRAAVDDPTSTVAYLEWSAADGLDPYDPATWWTFHPALGHTITEEGLAADAESLPPGEWVRAYLNRWTSSRESIMDPDAWDRLAGDQPQPGSGLTLAYDVAHDRTRASLVAAWVVAGVAYGRVVRSGPGIDWLPLAIRSARQTLTGAWGPPVLAAPSDGPARIITDQLAAANVDVRTVAPTDQATGDGALLWRALNQRLVHDGSPSLRQGVENAATRPTAESWRLSPTQSKGPIDALRALSVAIRLADHTQTGKPEIHLDDADDEGESW